MLNFHLVSLSTVCNTHMKLHLIYSFPINIFMQCSLEFWRILQLDYKSKFSNF